MVKGINILLASSMVLGFGAFDLAIAEGESAPAASNQAAPTGKPRLHRRLGKRLGQLRNRFHRRKAAPAAPAGQAVPGAAPETK
jgi:hypothetical protein